MALLVAGVVILVPDTPVQKVPSGGEASGPVTYEITGSGTAARVDFSGNDATEPSQRTDVPLPFRVSVPAAGVPSVYTVVAQNGANGGSISCSIARGGKELDEQTADGSGVLVACSGSAHP